MVGPGLTPQTTTAAREIFRQLARLLLGAVLLAEGFKQPVEPHDPRLELLGRRAWARRLRLQQRPPRLADRVGEVAPPALGELPRRVVGQRPERLRTAPELVARDGGPQGALHRLDRPAPGGRVAVERRVRVGVRLGGPVRRVVEPELLARLLQRPLDPRPVSRVGQGSPWCGCQPVAASIAHRCPAGNCGSAITCSNTRPL